MGSQGSTALTLEDFLALCEAAPEGVRYEAVGGRAVVVPFPPSAHQFAVLELAYRLRSAVPAGLHVLTAPLDWVLWQVPTLTVRQPDVLVVTGDQLRDDRQVTPPVVVVEVLSPSTRAVDLHHKRKEYAQAGAQHYWIVDHEVPSIEALTLDPGTGDYRTAAWADGSTPLTVTAPFDVTVVPSDLVV